MDVMQQLVLQPGFVLPASAGSVRQIREHTQWDLPPTDVCPQLWERLPSGYPEINSGHDSPVRLTKDERKLIRNGVPYHKGFPEPKKLDPNDEAQCSAATVKKYNELRNDILALRPRVNASVFLLAQLFDPAISGDGAEDLRLRMAGPLQSQLDLLLDDWVKLEQESRALVLTDLKRFAHRYRQRDDVPAGSLLDDADRSDLASYLSAQAARQRAFPSAPRGSAGGNGNGRGSGNGSNGGSGRGPASGKSGKAGANKRAGNGGSGNNGGGNNGNGGGNRGNGKSGGKGPTKSSKPSQPKSEADPADAQAARSDNDAAGGRNARGRSTPPPPRSSSN